MTVAIFSKDNPKMTFCTNPPVSSYDFANITESICSCFHEAINIPVNEIFIRNDRTGNLDKVNSEAKKFLDSYKISYSHLSKLLNHSISLSRVTDLLRKFFKTTDNADQICDDIIRMSSSEPLPPSERTDTSICKGSWFYREYTITCQPLHCWGNRNKPKAIIVGGMHDTQAWKFPGEEQSSDFYKVLYKMYDFCRLNVWDRFELEQALKDFVSKNGKVDFLGLQLHGEPEQVMISRDSSSGRYLNMGINDSFDYLQDILQKNGTIFLSACSTGRGKESRYNFANHIANFAPSDATVIAPIKPSYSNEIELLEQSNGKPRVMIPDKYGPLSWEEMTYTIDPQNRAAHCAKNPTHLKMCRQP